MSQSGITKLDDRNLPVDVPTSFVTDSGTAVPVAHVLEILGLGGASTSGIGNIVYVTAGATVSTLFTANTGTATPAANNINIFGASTIAGSSPVTSTASGSTLTVDVQTSQAIAASDATKIGLCSFDSSRFGVDANGFVTLTSTGVAETITGNSGGALSPTANNWNIVGSGSITTSGAASTLTVQLTGLTNHAVLVGAGTNIITKLAVGSNGQVLIGATGADPAFATLTSTGSTITFTPGANTLNLEAGASVPTTFTANSGTAIPALNNINILGAVVAAGTAPLTTSAAGSTVTINAQKSQSLAGADATKIGLCNFDSTSFSVDANGFVTLAGGGLAIDSIGTQTGTNPIVPTAAGLVTINGAVVLAGTNPVRSDGTGANTMAIEVQISQALAATDVTKIGLSNFNSSHFTVDANGFVALSGTGPGLTITGQSGGALSPTAGNWNISGAVTAAGTSPVVTSGAVSTLTVNVQKSQAIAGADATKVGLCNFSTASFAVDANGFVTLLGAGEAIDSIGVDATSGAGTNPVLPTAAGLVTVNGALVASGTNPIRSVSTAVNVYQIQVQTSQALAGTDATKVGLANFDSSSFAVDANGFVTTSATGVGKTITGDSGGALSPSSSNWNILGRSGSKTVGSGATLTIKSPPYADQGGSTTVTLNSGSFATAAITLTLPASAGLLDGDLFEFVCTTASALAIQAVGAQKIRVGSAISSAAGTMTSNAIGDAMVLRFRATDGFFYATSVIGTWTPA
jgi:hypothetical protein